MTHEIYPVCSSRTQDSHSPARHTACPPRGPQPYSSNGRVNPFAPKQGVIHKKSEPNFKFHYFTNPLGINRDHGVYVSERSNFVASPPHYTLKPTASSCSLGQLENEYVEEGRDKELPLEYLHFLMNPRYPEGFWHLSKYFFASADRQYDYVNALFTRDAAPYRMYQKYDPFYLQFGFLHPTQMDVNNQTHKVNRTKM